MTVPNCLGGKKATALTRHVSRKNAMQATIWQVSMTTTTMKSRVVRKIHTTHAVPLIPSAETTKSAPTAIVRKTANPVKSFAAVPASIQ